MSQPKSYIQDNFFKLTLWARPLIGRFFKMRRSDWSRVTTYPASIWKPFKGCTTLPEDEFRLIMKTVAIHLKSIFMYHKIFCHSGKNHTPMHTSIEPGILIRVPGSPNYPGTRILWTHSASYCFIMNERLFLENQPKSARIVSNILNEEVKKHDANRDLLVAFDDDFVAQQKFWDSD